MSEFKTGLVSIKTTTTRECRVELSAEEVIRVLCNYFGLDVPDDASVYIQVPGGGDWSNQKLDVDADCPVVVLWREEVTEVGDG